jgi:hypothetical protein
MTNFRILISSWIGAMKILYRQVQNVGKLLVDLGTCPDSLQDYLQHEYAQAGGPLMEMLRDLIFLHHHRQLAHLSQHFRLHFLIEVPNT